MDRSNFGSTADIISRITDPNQLQAMLRNPQYAGFTSVIIARLTEINHMRQAAQGAAPQAPTVAQQAAAGQVPPPQGMARGGIVAFRSGGKVKKLDDYKYKNPEYVPPTPKDIPMDITPQAPVAGPNMNDLLQQLNASTPASAPAATGVRGFAVGGDLTSAMKAFKQYNPPEQEDSHIGMEHAPVTTSGWTNPFSLVDPYQEQLDREIAARQAIAAKTATPAVAQPATADQSAPAVQYDPNYFAGAGSADSDLYSVGVSSGRRGAGYFPATPGIKPTAEYIKAQQDYMGPNTDMAAARQQLADMIQSRKSQAANSLNMAMIRAGLGMAGAASDNPRAGILGNLATGATQGLGQYTAERDALNKDQAEELQRQVQLGQISRQEAADLYRYGAGEHRADVQAAKAVEVAKMQEAAANARDTARLAAMNRSAQVMDKNAWLFAKDAYARDVANNVPPKTRGEYYQLGLGQANQQTGIMGLRQEMGDRATLAKIYSEAEKQQPGSGARAVQMYQMVGSGAPTGGKNYGALQ